MHVNLLNLTVTKPIISFYLRGKKKKQKQQKIKQQERSAAKQANETRIEAKYSCRTDHKSLSNIYDEVIVTTTKLLFSIE